jgi:heme/copper-type cytochrome/quinol oxidase subunit 3
MSVNQELLGKGVKKLLLLTLLLIVSPITLNIAFKALKKTEDLVMAYGLLAVAVILIILTLILAFKTFKTFLDALFDN